MTREFQKNLSRPEARHRYWHIYKDDRDFFPESGKIFKLKFHEKTYDMKVNHKNDVMTGQLYGLYQFLEGHRITVSKTKTGKYSLEAPDTKLYPEVD